MSKHIGNESRRTIECPPRKKKRAVIYARYSSDNQREESIDAQIRYCEEYAEKEGYEIVWIYKDEAQTAKNDLRDDFQKMIAAAKNDEFDIVLVHKFNRFARNKFDSVLYKKRLQDIGIRVVSATQKIDDTPEGKMLEGILEAMDEYYSANLSLEVEKGLRENAIKGLSLGGTPPIGYRYDDAGKLVKNENAALVQQIFDLYLQGYGMNSIANYLNKRGYRGQRGKPFSQHSIGAILDNEKYIGTQSYTLKGVEYRFEHNHEPIIDKRDFERAQAMRVSNTNTTKARFNDAIMYNLTGKMVCGICGKNYHGGGRKGRVMVRTGERGDNIYYVCPNKRYKMCSNKNVNKDKIETHIARYIINNLLNDDAINGFILAFKEELEKQKANTSESQIERLKTQRTALQNKRKKLLDLYLDDDNDNFTKEELDERIRAIKEELSGVEKEISALSVINKTVIDEKAALGFMQNIKSDFTLCNKMTVKALLDTFVEKVIVHEDTIEIEYRVDLNRFVKLDGTDESVSVGVKVNSALADVTISPIYLTGCTSHKEIRRTKRGY